MHPACECVLCLDYLGIPDTGGAKYSLRHLSHWPLSQIYGHLRRNKFGGPKGIFGLLWSHGTPSWRPVSSAHFREIWQILFNTQGLVDTSRTLARWRTDGLTGTVFGMISCWLSARPGPGPAGGWLMEARPRPSWENHCLEVNHWAKHSHASLMASPGSGDSIKPSVFALGS